MFRICLTGPVSIEVGDRRVDERTFGGHQVRLMLAFLVLERNRPVHRDELAETIWPYGLPSTWPPALRALVSKTRALLMRVGHTTADAISQSLGCYQAHLPDLAEVDTEVAALAVNEAEEALREKDSDRALGAARAATAVAQRPFLVGDEGPWIDRQRVCLHALLLRAVQALSESHLRRGEFELALAAAEEAVSLAPFRETTNRQVMRVHAAAGDRSEALRVYERCRVLMLDELGVEPSTETQTLYLNLLRS